MDQELSSSVRRAVLQAVLLSFCQGVGGCRELTGYGIHSGYFSSARRDRPVRSAVLMALLPDSIRSFVDAADGLCHEQVYPKSANDGDSDTLYHQPLDRAYSSRTPRGAEIVLLTRWIAEQVEHLLNRCGSSITISPDPDGPGIVRLEHWCKL